MSQLSEAVCRASWEPERESIRRFLLVEKKFNPKAVDRVINNFIDRMAFARLPCGTEAGIAAAWKRWKFENERHTGAEA